MTGNSIICGDCLDVMARMEGESVDSIVTDPPYGLSFMGKEWDHGVPGIPFWEAALRVAKPGAHLLAFGGTRTFHRLTCAIEDAGWEIRDCVMWIYGSGFPKSHDVSKAIDKEAKVHRRTTGPNPNARPSDYRGCGVYGAGNGSGHARSITTPATPQAEQWEGWGTALKPAWEPVIVARKPFKGTVAGNVLEHGTGGINIDRCRVAGAPPSVPQPAFNSPTGQIYGFETGEGRNGDMSQATGRWPANVIHDGSDEVMAEFAKAGESRSTERRGYPGGHTFGGSEMRAVEGQWFGDSGTAARFFYCAKASRKERRGSKHPTVKPLALMRYLVKLVTPPNGIVLDPFAGTGTTAEACILEGFRYVCIDKDESACADAEKRIADTQVPLLQEA